MSSFDVFELDSQIWGFNSVAKIKKVLSSYPYGVNSRIISYPDQKGVCYKLIIEDSLELELEYNEDFLFKLTGNILKEDLLTYNRILKRLTLNII